MTEATRDLFTTALGLTTDERFELAEALLESVIPEVRPELSDEYMITIRRRSEELASGSVRGIPWEEVKRTAREAIRGRD